MNNDQLTAYLKDESYLYSLSFEELRTLVVQYPYATNLRVLLLKKSFIEQNKDYDRNLQMAAAYSTNRRFLYKMVKKLKTLQNVPENVILGEDYLELTELSNIERILSERHVTEVYADKPTLSDMGLQLDWGSADFQDSAAGKSDDINEPFDMPLMPEISVPILDEEQDVPHKHNNQDVDVNLAIENIMLEFGSQAIDLTGWQDISNEEHLTNLDALAESITFVNEELGDDSIDEPVGDDFDFSVDASPPHELQEDNPREMPHSVEPIEFDNLEEISSIPESNELENSIIDEEIGHFEELDDNAEFIENPSVIAPETEQQEHNSQSEEQYSHDFGKSEPDDSIENAAKFVVTEALENAYFIEPEQTTESLFIEDNDMKKSDVEIEIVNQAKTVIVEKSVEEPVMQPKLSFSEWLRQFKMTSAEDSSTQKPTIHQNTPVQSLQLIEETRSQVAAPVDNKHVLDEKIVALMFEQPNQLPDNLFNLNDSPSNVSLEGFFADNNLDNIGDDLPKKKKKKKNMHALAVKSIEENDDLISETLADLLAFQGNNNRAIEMYMRLCLQVPEKSDYFAAKIEKLRNTG